MFRIHNETIIEFGFRVTRRIMSIWEDMMRRDYAELGNILLDLHNSSHPTRPNSIMSNLVVKRGNVFIVMRRL